MTYLKKVVSIETKFDVGDRVVASGYRFLPNGELQDCTEHAEIVGINPADGSYYCRFGDGSVAVFEEENLEAADTPHQCEHLTVGTFGSGRYELYCVRCNQVVNTNSTALWERAKFQDDQLETFKGISGKDVIKSYEREIQAIAELLQCPALPLRARFRGGSDRRWEDWPPEKAWEVAEDLDRDLAEGHGDENYLRISINLLSSKLRCPLPEPVSYSAGNKTPRGWIERQEKTRHLKSGIRTYEYLYYRYEEWQNGRLVRTRAVRVDPKRHSHLACLIKAYKCSVEEILERRSEWEA